MRHIGIIIFSNCQKQGKESDPFLSFDSGYITFIVGATIGCGIAYRHIWCSTCTAGMLFGKGGTMALSEKLYALRKKSGLSQEQLAEQLNVSRQAISKWESGQSVPESGKLVAISKFFNISLDYLMGETEEQNNCSVSRKKDNSIQTGNRTKWLFGIIICVSGSICLIIWGLVSIINPAATGQISESSIIKIDGSCIYRILCIAAIVAGAVLLLKNTAKK